MTAADFFVCAADELRFSARMIADSERCPANRAAYRVFAAAGLRRSRAYTRLARLAQSRELVYSDRHQDAENCEPNCGRNCCDEQSDKEAGKPCNESPAEGLGKGNVQVEDCASVGVHNESPFNLARRLLAIHFFPLEVG